MRKFRIGKYFSNFTTLGGAITLLGLFATAFITTYIYRSLHNEDRIRFEYEAEEIVRRIQFRVDNYMGAILQTRAFVLSSEHITHDEFKSYIQNSNLLNRFPGIRGMGLVDENGTTIFMEPPNSDNNSLIGKNQRDNKIHLEAMERAVDTGLPSLTEQESYRDKLVFNIFVPYFQKNKPLNTPEERQKYLEGFIYTPFETRFIFNSIFEHQPLELDIEIFDQNLIFKTDHFHPITMIEREQFIIEKKLEIGGRDIKLLFTPSKKFNRKFSLTLLFAVALCGILITFIITRIFWFIGKQVELGHKTSKALKEALEARDEFLSIASHELKTPITSLKLQAQMIKRSMQKADKNALSWDKINALADQTDRQADRLTRLVNDMVDISRIRTGKLGIEKEHFDMCDLMKEIVERMKDEFAEIPGQAPKVVYCEEAMGCWDKGRMEEVIINLLTNAIKYGNKKSIEITVCSDPTHVKIEVRDFGIGISPEYQEKIFDRFERAGVSASEVSGLGLGLYITKQIVELHHGKIWVESKKNEGSKFVVNLPRKV